MALLAAMLALIAGACGQADEEGAGDATTSSGAEPSATSEAAGDAGSAGGSAGASADETADGAGSSGVELEYWMWPAGQVPAYQRCADAFTAETGIGVSIVQHGFGEYWDLLSTSLASGQGPDVFADHVTRFPQFVDQQIMVPLDDSVGPAADEYQVPAMADLWFGTDGQRYGYPKDFDSIGLVANNGLLAEAGVDPTQLDTLDWNLADGGTFQQTIAHLSVDANGVRGDEAGFDPQAVEVYGFVPSVAFDDPYSRTGWSIFAVMNGWSYADRNPWPTAFNYDDPALHEVLTWYRSLVDAGFMPPADVQAASSGQALFEAGSVALLMDGSWTVDRWANPELFDDGVTFAPVPAGPDGTRVAMINGLSDAVNAAGDNQPEALQWAGYLASAACQDVVATEGVVIPALSSAADLAAKTFEARNIDIEPFFAAVDDGEVYLFPISNNSAEVGQLAGQALEAYLSGNGDLDGLAAANDQINSLLSN